MTHAYCASQGELCPTAPQVARARRGSRQGRQWSAAQRAFLPPAAAPAVPTQRRQACSVDLRAEDAAGLEDGSVRGAAVLPPGTFVGASARYRPRRALVLLCLRL